MKIKVLKDSHLCFRVSGWKRELIKQIAAKDGITLSALFDQWVESEIQRAGINARVGVIQESGEYVPQPTH